MFPEKNPLAVESYRSRLFCVLFLAIFVALPAWAQKQRGDLLIQPNVDGNYQVPLYKSGVIELDQAARKISVGNPGVADILMLHNRQLYVAGKALGTTNVVVWDKNERIFASFNIEVTHDLDTLKRKLYQLLPDEAVEVYSAQERIILNGEVSSVVKMKAAEDLAQGFLPECINPQSQALVRDATQGVPVAIQQGSGTSNLGASSNQQGCDKGSIVNLMQVGGAHQVMIEIKVAEIARTILKRFNSNFNIFNFGNDWNAGATSGGGAFPGALAPTAREVILLAR